DSSLDSACTSQPNSVSVCPLYADNDTCVTAYRDGVTYRGCSSSLQCEASNSKSCVQCVGSACNTINLERADDDNYGKWQDLPLTCLSCSGDECSSANVTQSQCENNNEQDCVTVFEDGAVVRRGCSDAVELEHATHCSTNEDDCLYCKSNACNNATAKSQYNECIHCDSYKNLSCLWDAQSSIHKTRLCQGSCMTALYPSDVSEDSAYELIRTCLDDKDADERLTCAGGSDALCKSCTGNKCNTDIIPTDRRSCYQCEGDDCEEPQVQVCPLYKSDDQCFIWYDETNSVSQMGCLSSFRNQELETIISTKRIYLCDGEACNSLDAAPTPQTCAVCNSTEDFTCATNPQEIGTFNTCSQYPYTSCYTKLVSTDGSTTRGCLSDLDTTDFVGCVL
ncbi:uncharacterized protein LOC118732685, partial [Rhagoletis pomonella]|uniref:uncharacterized protein LOC118732685 n=1 Tax=Rhagoletis pomonella TaxID=28610 RepID=UPI00177F0ADE